MERNTVIGIADPRYSLIFKARRNLLKLSFQNVIQYSEGLSLSSDILKYQNHATVFYPQKNII